MAYANLVLKLYKSIIEDVIEGVRDIFAEEGLEEQVLKDLKQLWETKVMQSKATEGFFRRGHQSPQFTLQLPHNFHHILQASTASVVIPAGRGFQHLTAADLGASRVGATLTFPSGISYPIHVPAGVTLQTASGHLYKVNVPVMVTQAAGDASILHHPVQQIFHPPGQPSAPQASIASVAQVNASSAQAAADTLQPQETAVQQTTVCQPNVVEKKHLEEPANTSFIQQPPVSQQQLVENAALNRCADSSEISQRDSLHMGAFTPESSKGSSPTDPVANNSSSVLLDVEQQGGIEPQESVQQQVPDDIIDLIIVDDSLDDDTVLKYQNSIAPFKKMEPTEQMESNLRSEKYICSDIEGIIQLDGTGDISPREELLCTKDMEENEFIGIIESEDLKVLEDEEDAEECDSVSNTESSSSSGDNEEPQIDVVEEDYGRSDREENNVDPLNSGDDVSEQDIPDLFDTDNVIVCQYDKIHRSKNKWKFFLKDGVMSFEGKEHVFAKAVGDAEW